MRRYLLNVSYLGNKFRGSQIQAKSLDRTADDFLTIQGRVEMGLKKLRPKYHPTVKISSRTDAGVHALHSTMHVDLCQLDGKPYDPRTVTVVANKYFNKLELPIKILKTYLVPNTFDCRLDVLSKTYLYRIAVIKMDNISQFPFCHIPVEHIDRCYFLGSNEFDVDNMREAAKLFLGYHDFRTFCGRSSKTDKITRRSIDRLDIEEANPLCYSNYSWPFCISSHVNDYKFYNIYIKSRGFLYRQVRRTVASLLGVAQGKVTTKDIKFMLEIPSHRSWNPKLQTVPARGLYLCEVAYSQPDLETFKETLEDIE